MPLNQPLLPVLGKPPIQGPLTVPQTDSGAPLVLDPSWQRWIAELFRDVASLIGSNPNAPLAAGGVEYRFRSVARLSLPQSAVAKLVSVLGPQDIGLLVHVTDYNHVLEWNGTKLQWGPGDSGSNWFATGTPSAPGWHACDGAAISFLKGDGSLSPTALPVTPGTWFRI